MFTTDESDGLSCKILSVWVVLLAIDDDIGDKACFGGVRRVKRKSSLIDIDFFGKILCVFNHNSFIVGLLKNYYKKVDVRGRGINGKREVFVI